MRRQPRIGMIGLMLEEYNMSFPELKESRTAFAKDLVKAMEPFAEVSFKEIADTRSKVEGQIKYYENNDYDGLIIVFLTYAPSLVVCPGLAKSSLPIAIWNTQEATGIYKESDDSIIVDNHGVHGVQDLTNVLNRTKRKYLLITGHYRDNEAVIKVRNVVNAMKAVSTLKKSRIGLLGHSMQDMGDFNIDETAFLNQVGPSIRHISVDILADYTRAAPDSEVQNIMKADRARFIWDDNISDEECRLAAEMEWAIRKLISEYKLDGWAQHFMALGTSTRINMLPFLAACKLMEEGFGYGAEGDVTAAASFLIVRELVGQAGFTEMFCMSFDDESILMRHMGEGNIGFAKDPAEIKVVCNPFNMVDVAGIPTPVFSVRAGAASLLSLASDENGRFKLIVARGRVTDFPGRDCAVSLEYKWCPVIPLNDFLTEYAYAGGTHHQALGYGDLTEAVEIFGKFMDLEVIKIC